MRSADLLLRRLSFYASLAAGLFGAIVALFACAVAALAGHAPSPGLLAAIVVGAGVVLAVLARLLIARIPWLGLAGYAARRIADRRAARRP